MSNSRWQEASREEEIAFLALEQVLDVDITLADAGSGNRQPDGSWKLLMGRSGRAVVEVTSPPSAALLTEWARAKRAGLPQVESGSMPVHHGRLSDVFDEMLAAGWARENLAKLTASVADERHLFLFPRRYREAFYFYRLSEPDSDGEWEQVGDLRAPNGISDIWFRGRSTPDPKAGSGHLRLRLARFEVGVGWHRYIVTIDEYGLPSPNPRIACDNLADLRSPKLRMPEV